MNEQQTESILAKARDMLSGSADRPEWTKIKIVLLLLHVAALLYTGSHGVMASLSYAGNSSWAIFGQIFGILLTEATILYIYIQWASGKITDTAESICAAMVYLGCLVLAALNSVVDSRLNAGGQLTPTLLWHLQYGLPLSPVFVLLGISAIEIADPDVWSRRKKRTKNREADMARFDATMANADAELEIEKEIQAIELATKRAKAIAQAQYWQSQLSQTAIDAQARRDLPALLHRAGIDLDGDGVLDVFFPDQNEGSNATRQARTVASNQPSVFGTGGGGDDEGQRPNS